MLLHGEDRPSPKLWPDKMARGARGVTRRAKLGGFGGVPLGVLPDARRSRAGSFTGSIMFYTFRSEIIASFLGVTSEAGKGSTFTIWVPLEGQVK